MKTVNDHVRRDREGELERDPMNGLSAAELAEALDISIEELRRREQAGELFSVLRPARRRGREYAAFQAWPGVAGAPLQCVMKTLGGLESTDRYGFFAGVTDLLLGLTPVEVLSGRALSARKLGPEARLLLRASMQTRLHAVVSAAEALVHLRAA